MKILKQRIPALPAKRLSSVAVERIRGRAGATIRERILKRDGYLCVSCAAAGRVVPAVEVDHIVPLHVGGREIDNNRQSLCRACHLAKSAIEQQQR